MNVRLAIILFVTLGACARSREPQLYTLSASEARRTWELATVLEVRRPHIAGYLDRREVVRRVLAQRLEVDRQALWAEPLDALLGRTLATDLALRLPNSQIVSESSTIGAAPRMRVELDLQRFESDENELVLRALVSVRDDSPAPAKLEQVELRRALGGTDIEAQVSTMTSLLGELSDRIAQGLAARAQQSAETTH